MAATLTLTSSTPYALKYHFFYDGAGGASSGSIDRAQATLVADADGTLRDALQNADTDAEWDALADGPSVSVYIQLKGTQPVCADLSPTLTGRVLRVRAPDGQVAIATVEIRFHHTIDR